MGYRADGKLADLFPKDFVSDTSKAITDEVGTRLRDKVAVKTPVARTPQAYKGDYVEWITDRGGRQPRTMRDSWTRTKVEENEDGSGGYTVEVFSDEPADARGYQKVDYVEEDTKPHLIRARHAKSLRFPQGPVFRYAVEVFHPGTQGVHMVRDSEAEIEAQWEQIAGPIVDSKEQEYDGL